MSNRIKLLPEVVANQIAAGEVVNRPSSVVKEMMENAVDAGATSVKVNFRDGGKELIQIVDDGCGMSPIDARMAFDRHATSKIKSVDDIYALQTFGFRGEALPSIAAVSQVELRSRQEQDELGTTTEINGGEFVAQTPVMCPVGSQFFVRNLFYNVPARRRFLDKSTTSASQIKTEFRRVALCYPKISFELYSNDAPIYSLMATSLAGRIVDVMGRHIKQNLLDVTAHTSIASVTGFIGRPSAAKRRNSEQYLFVNGRYFKSAYLVSAIMKAYEKLVPQNTQPSFFLYLTIDTARIDVNVHPQKTEVKFSDEEAVWQIVNAAVRETLAKTGAVPMMDFDEEAIDIPVLDDRAVYTEPRAMNNSSYNPFLQDFTGANTFEPTEDFTGFDLPQKSGDVGFGGDASSDEDLDFVSGMTDFESGNQKKSHGMKIPTAKGGAKHSFSSMIDQMSGDQSDFAVGQAEKPHTSMRQQPSDFLNLSFLKQTGFDNPLIKEEDAAQAAEIQEQIPSNESLDEFEDLPSEDFRDLVAHEESFEEVASAQESEFETVVEDASSDFEDIPSQEKSDFEDVPSQNVGDDVAFSQEDAFEDIASMDDDFEDIASPDNEASHLDFIASNQEDAQQKLAVDAAPRFTDIIPVGAAYIMAQLSGHVVVVDVRRAKERVLFDQYISMLDHGSALSQQLLFPERLELSNEEYALLEERAVDFAALGFDLDFLGGGAIDLKGTPADLPSDTVDQLLFELLQAFAMPVDLEQMRRERIAGVMARQGAKCGSRSLYREEAEALLQQLAATSNYSFTPSGKQILGEFTSEDFRAKLD